MNTLKTAAARFARLAPQGQMRWLKLAVYALVFLLPFGMALIALLVYLDDRRNGAAARASAALPAPVAPTAAAAMPGVKSGGESSASLIPQACLSSYCSNRH